MESTTYHDRKKPKKKAEPPPLLVTSLNKIKEDSKKGVSQTAQSHHEVSHWGCKPLHQHSETCQ